jgi:hypothetical protein
MATRLCLVTLLLAGTAACVESAEDLSQRDGCTADSECKNGRVCLEGICTYPDESPVTAPEADISRVVFRLSLSPNALAPVFVQKTAEDRPDAWLSLYRGTSESVQRLVAPCSACYCGACASCGGLCGPAIPAVKRLEPGHSIELRWDGTTFPIDSTCPGDGSCYSIRPVPEGEALRARFCWSLAATGFGEGHEILAPVSCQEVPFGYLGGEAQTVQFVIPAPF